MQRKPKCNWENDNARKNDNFYKEKNGQHKRENDTNNELI